MRPSDGGPGEIPRRLCAVALEVLPVTGASVSLHDHDMPVRLCASGAQAAYVTDIQATLGDGPCQSAVRSGRPVLACDLTAGRDAERWPVFAEEATGAGVRAAYSLPLGDETVCVGTFDLYRDRPGALTAGQLRTARSLAAAVTMALMAMARDAVDRASEGELDRTDWLDGLIDGHDGVYQAIGMVMAQRGVGAAEALALLRARAFADSRTVTEMARAVVEHRLRFPRDY
ncbi:GAF domain-containing protein [Streptomyces cinnabarinus]|uniref:GAF domain-containing protein n=1 Tax=Streptomyces cinnabarinus TaxID=67287 RepID=A0ABY7KRG7_9ACTN|nr:GAF domain-containing protein [Streptomyces cinnabarinus]WAZ27148.1 GAF domain-containing protein [Streptomyces cinnabarinus]